MDNNLNMDEVIKLHQDTYQRIIDIVVKSLPEGEIRDSALKQIESSAKNIIDNFGGNNVQS